MTNELKLFLVHNTSHVFPVFYVKASDITDATQIAQKIVDSLNNNIEITNVSAVKTPLLEWEE